MCVCRCVYKGVDVCVQVHKSRLFVAGETG